MSEQDDDPKAEHEMEQALSRMLLNMEEEPASPRLRVLARKLEEALAQARRKH